MQLQMSVLLLYEHKHVGDHTGVASDVRFLQFCSTLVLAEAAQGN